MYKDNRVAVTMMVWFLATIALSAVFISAGMMGTLTTGHITFAGVILVLATIATPLVYHLYDRNAHIDVGKAKRERIDNMLRDMSDEDLMELKKRLTDGELSEESLIDYVSADGELVFRN